MNSMATLILVRAIVCSLVLFLPVLTKADSKSAFVSIIIDDLGYKQSEDLKVVALPGPIVCAVMPHGPHSKTVAERAKQSGKEVILHLPMQATHDNHFLGPGALTLNMSQTEFIQTLRVDLNSVPHVIGLNNHMGSLLTQHPGHMQWLMDEIKQQGHFYIDSITSDNSVAAMLAEENQVPYLTRDIFLDNFQSQSYIRKQFQELIQVAKRRGHAIAIGHPHVETIQVLTRMIPELNKQGIQLISIREMLKRKQEG